MSSDMLHGESGLLLLMLVLLLEGDGGIAGVRDGHKVQSSHPHPPHVVAV